MRWFKRLLCIKHSPGTPPEYISHSPGKLEISSIDSSFNQPTFKVFKGLCCDIDDLKKYFRENFMVFSSRTITVRLVFTLGTPRLLPRVAQYLGTPDWSRNLRKRHPHRPCRHCFVAYAIPQHQSHQNAPKTSIIADDRHAQQAKFRVPLQLRQCTQKTTRASVRVGSIYQQRRSP